MCESFCVRAVRAARAAMRGATCAALVLAAPAVLPAQAPTTERIACGASSGARQTCNTNGVATRVDLVCSPGRQSCRNGVNWGNTDSSIWTNAGCLGLFRVTYRTGTGSATTRVIPCGTSSGARVQCNTEGHATNVRLVRDRSGGRCRQGDSWGFTSSIIWANGGCRGDFEVTYRAQPRPR